MKNRENVKIQGRALGKGDEEAVVDQTVIIAINSGVGLRMIGNTGQYVKEFADAMKFANEIEAYEYIERHGLEKISSVRKYAFKQAI